MIPNSASTPNVAMKLKGVPVAFSAITTPIVMTKVTCIAGLVPLMLFAGPLWKGMAIGMIGGLALGTLVTLGLIPLLYEVLFGMKWPGSKRSHEAVQQPVQPV